MSNWYKHAILGDSNINAVLPLESMEITVKKMKNGTNSYGVFADNFLIGQVKDEGTAINFMFALEYLKQGCS